MDCELFSNDGTPQFAWRFPMPLRRVIVSPDTIVDHLSLSNSSPVLYLGTGPGYFGVTLVSRLENGWLALCELQPEMLSKTKRELHNVSHAVGDALMLP